MFFSSVDVWAHKAHSISNTCRAFSKVVSGAMVKVMCAEGSDKETWRFSTIKELREQLIDQTQDEIVDVLDVVDVLTLGCRSSPIPVKSINDKDAFTSIGHYKGTKKITEALLEMRLLYPSMTQMEKGLEPTRYVDGHIFQ